MCSRVTEEEPPSGEPTPACSVNCSSSRNGSYTETRCVGVGVGACTDNRASHVSRVSAVLTSLLPRTPTLQSELVQVESDSEREWTRGRDAYQGYNRNSCCDCEGAGPASMTLTYTLPTSLHSNKPWNTYRHRDNV